MADDATQRLEKLESVIAHLEHQLDQIHQVVLAQGKTLDRLKKEMQRQSTAMETMELERIKANITKPPHYQ